MSALAAKMLFVPIGIVYYMMWTTLINIQGVATQGYGAYVAGLGAILSYLIARYVCDSKKSSSRTMQWGLYLGTLMLIIECLMLIWHSKTSEGRLLIFVAFLCLMVWCTFKYDKE